MQEEAWPHELASAHVGRDVAKHSGEGDILEEGVATCSIVGPNVIKQVRFLTGDRLARGSQNISLLQSLGPLS